MDISKIKAMVCLSLMGVSLAGCGDSEPQDRFQTACMFDSIDDAEGVMIDVATKDGDDEGSYLITDKGILFFDSFLPTPRSYDEVQRVTYNASSGLFRIYMNTSEGQFLDAVGHIQPACWSYVSEVVPRSLDVWEQ